MVTVSALKILVVDDDRNILRTLMASLRPLGCEPTAAASAEAALEALAAGSFDLVLTDVRLGGLSGIELIGRARRLYPKLTFIAMTAYASYENAVGAIKEGAFDYLPKPFSIAQLEHMLAKARALIDLQRENEVLRRTRGRPELFVGFNSPAIRRLEEMVRKVAPTDATVLVVGESGTGKSELARVIHDRSTRAAGPFVEVNCAALAETLLESELFGHVKGAFTGAVQDKPGKLELAAGGTVFLDEVGELSPGGQTKLLRFLQERVVERVGGSKPVAVDARVVAATNRKLDEAVATGKFREDLYYRLNVFECVTVPLRQRREDLPVLIQQLFRDEARRAGYDGPPAVPADVRARLLEHSWPGNIRELRNVVERLVILAQGGAVSLGDLPTTVAAPTRAVRTDNGDAGALERSLKDVEREHIERVLAVASSLEAAAQILGITTVTLWRKRKDYGLE